MVRPVTRVILRRYSLGELGWREACRQLDIKLDELHALMQAHGLPLYSPPPEEASGARDALNDWLDG